MGIHTARPRERDGDYFGPVDAVATNLPGERTEFVGRDRALAELERLTAINRVITLTGVGGVGKTRLAIQLLSEYQRGLEIAGVRGHAYETRAMGQIIDEVAGVLTPEDLAAALEDGRQLSGSAPSKSPSTRWPMRVTVLNASCSRYTA